MSAWFLGNAFLAGNLSFLLTPIFFYLRFFFCISSSTFFCSSSSEPDHTMAFECDVVVVLLVYSMSTLYLIIVQMNADIWFQLSSLRRIIGTKFLRLSSLSLISSIYRNICSFFTLPRLTLEQREPQIIISP